jgi:hypothetical protein
LYRVGGLPVLRVELRAGFAQPADPTLDSGEDPLHVESFHRVEGLVRGRWLLASGLALGIVGGRAK